ncbi:MAG TPA: 23S rRNA (adenine(2503)-C(2))-methyltransferase RlmN [Kiritimatiellia bacterium]|nr:23S rRNA (adenine(2503)-C(2))-methyltransferase RlmN [Kiritimatiellia bacterium]
MISVFQLEKLDAWARAHALPEHRLKRFRIAFFKKGAPLAACMEEIPEPIRDAFASSIDLGDLRLAFRQNSSQDGASKLTFLTHDGHPFEAVILRVASGRTSLCISSQAGCAANCAFCATGKLGLARDLTPAEILGQVIAAKRILHQEGRLLRNVVFMGMGEPFHNEKNVYAAIDLLRDVRGFYLSDRHIMVSTVGMVAAIARFQQRYPAVRLALSLHSARQDLRRQLMPAAKSQTLDKLRGVLPPAHAPYPMMIEVLLLEGVNDSDSDIDALIDYLRGVNAHINLIQFNPFPGTEFRPVHRTVRERTAAILRRAGFKVTLRRSLGDDIAAACGQLAAAS